jgi:hypothetical protein
MSLQDQLNRFDTPLRRARITAHEHVLGQRPAEVARKHPAFVRQRVQQIVSTGFELPRRMSHQRRDVIGAFVEDVCDQRKRGFSVMRQ